MSKIIGYTQADDGSYASLHEPDKGRIVTQADDGSYASLHEPDKGRIVTQAFILCSECNKSVYHCMGPNYRAICLECFKAKKQVTQNV